MATVNVLIPCYNYGRYLVDCVQSVLSQEGVEVSVLIIDDCSSDNTPDVCMDLSRKDSRVKFIRHEVNKGHIATYNEGIALARSKYFTLLSADDLLTPGALGRATRIMEENPSVGLVYGHPIPFSDDVLPPARTSSSKSTIWSGREWVRMVCKSGKNFITSPEAVVRTSVQQAVGGYTPELPHSGDMEMWLRIAAISDVGHVNDADQAYYRRHPKSMQRTIHAGFLFDLEHRWKAIDSAFRKEAGGLPDADELLSIAKRTLGLTAIRNAYHIRQCWRDRKQPIEKYRSLALSLDPTLAGTREHRWLLKTDSKTKKTLSRWIGRGQALVREAFIREVLDRIERYRARQTGIFFPRRVE
ncbi:MAG: glycosyltransferase [Rhizobiaceae bacterium]|nr:glycosyltransferase [Rhizobiaceae bacterium]